MRKYEKIFVKITKFNIENIITASGVVTDASTLTGERLELYETYYENSDVKNTDVVIFNW